MNFFVGYPAKPGNLATELNFQRTNFNDDGRKVINRVIHKSKTPTKLIDTKIQNDTKKKKFCYPLMCEQNPNSVLTNQITILCTVD